MTDDFNPPPSVTTAASAPAVSIPENSQMSSATTTVPQILPTLPKKPFIRRKRTYHLPPDHGYQPPKPSLTPEQKLQLITKRKTKTWSNYTINDTASPIQIDSPEGMAPLLLPEEYITETSYPKRDEGPPQKPRSKRITTPR